MTILPNSTRFLRSAITLIDPNASAVQRIIVLRHNPGSLACALQAQAVCRQIG